MPPAKQALLYDIEKVLPDIMPALANNVELRVGGLWDLLRQVVAGMLLFKSSHNTHHPRRPCLTGRW
jgi:hypothetical protein